MILLFANSEDGTADLLVRTLGTGVFRYNFDLFSQYEIEFSPSFWKVSNPAGFSISSKTVSRMFWWKAFVKSETALDNFFKEEQKYVFRELYNWGRLRGLTRGNPPDFHNRMGKVIILDLATRFFRIPRSAVCLGRTAIASLASCSGVVVKSLSSAPTSDKRALYTSRIELNQLDEHYLWFIQEEVVSEADITVFLCGSKFFFFQKSRKKLKGIDWRAEQTLEDLNGNWELFSPSISFENRLKEFSTLLGVNWGRFDFLAEAEDPIFLEFNANGQWVFLDYSGAHGLVAEVARYLITSDI